jgi:hypothetical protein
VTLPYVTHSLHARVFAALLVAFALAVVPSAANASNGLAGYKAKGIVVANSGSTLTVCVGTGKKATNKRARAWQGGPVVFNIAQARLNVKDLNGDGSRNAADVLVGSRVKVGAKLPKVLTASGPFVAQKVKVDSKQHKKPKKGYAGGSCPVDDSGSDVNEPEPTDDDDFETDPWFGGGWT